jgi:cysteine desulfurase / selenocysteine lyase
MKPAFDSSQDTRGMALVPRSDFPGLGDSAYFYSAAEGPMLASVAASLQEYAAQKSRAEAGRAHHAAVLAQCKTALARLLGVVEGDLALLGSASEGIAAVGSVIDFQAGDNVVTNDLEYPSSVIPWLRLKPSGVDVRVIRHRRWEIGTDDLLNAVDARTRLVVLSHVSFVNGLRHDIEAIAAGVRKKGALFLVDATQSLGVLPVPTTCADFLVSSSYKWLLGVHGLGILYWNRTRRPNVEPAYVGRQSVVDAFGPQRFEEYTLKPDADRFGLGFVNLPGAYALSRSVPYLLSVGIERIAAHVLALGGMLLEGLNDLGFEVMTPLSPDRRGASISFAHSDAARIGEALAERGIFVWAGQGRVRVSLHLFNGAEDVTRLIALLAEIRGRG